MDLNMELIKAVREAQNATQKAQNEFSETARRYSLTPTGKENEAARLFGASRAEAEAAKAKGFAAIDQKCAELDAQEQAAAERRNADTEYLNRLETKLRIFSGIDAQEQSDATLKAFFAEFADDPMAIAAINKAVGSPMRAVNIVPADNTGMRQKHLQEIVKPSFERTINKAGALTASTSDLAGDLATAAVFGNKSEIDAFCTYCTEQDADFSLDDVEVWKKIRGERAQNQQANDGAFHMSFTGVRPR